jgi:hypothetical protein
MKNGFKYINKEKSLKFIEEHNLLDDLLNAKKEIEKIFENPTLILKVWDEYDFAENPELSLIIQTDLSVEASQDKWHKLNNDWWHDYSDQLLGILSIDLGWK